jgi:hypothetical protein
MGDIRSWEAKRALHYLVPFKEIDKESRSSILHSATSSKRFNNEYEIKVAAAMIRYSQIEEALEELHPIIPIRVGGASNKVLQALTGNADCFLSFSERSKFWDMVAGHALFTSRFGIVTDKDGKPISYKTTNNSNSIPNGIMFFRSEGFAKEVNGRLADWLTTSTVEKRTSNLTSDPSKTVFTSWTPSMNGKRYDQSEV